MMTQADPDTGPLRVMAEQGLTTREIAKRTHMSQSTVSRRLRQIREAEAMLRRRQFWQAVAVVLFLLCMAAIAAALVADAVTR